jgi:peroxiredoxin
MKKIVLSVLFAGSVLLAQAQPAPPKPAATDIDRGYKVKVGDQAPDDYQLVLSDGRKTSLKELRGKVVVLQFTASWCGVCRQEMPHLQKDVWEANKDKDFILIGVDRDEPLDQVKKFQQDMKITYPLALDPGADIFGRYADKKSGVTRNVVIDRTGRIVYLTRLYNPVEFKAMVKIINALVNKTGV